MHNPLTLLTPKLLDALIAQGNLYFVRQPYERGRDRGETAIKHAFLFSHYTNKEEASKHRNLLFDGLAAFYDASIQEEKEKLYIAASQPEGFKIYAALLKDREWKPTTELEPKIKHYIRVETKWKPERGDVIAIGLALQFGELIIKLKKGRDEIKVPLSHIEKY